MEKGKRSSCSGQCGGVQIPTDEELIALGAMRAIKREVTILKARMRQLPGDAASLAALEREVARFKTEWREWDERRRAAAHKRMVLLGHEDPV